MFTEEQRVNKDRRKRPCMDDFEKISKKSLYNEGTRHLFKKKKASL